MTPTDTATSTPTDTPTNTPTATPVASVVVSPTDVTAGGVVTATWTDLPNPSASDWLGLYPLGAVDQGYLARQYVGCQLDPTLPQASGACTFTAPATPGSYEVRLFANDSLLRRATSAPFLVFAPPPTDTPTSTPTETATPTPTPTATQRPVEVVSIWGDAALPAVEADPDTGSVELGVKFRSSVAGHVRGIRFYKGPGNTGTHTGALWTRTGTKLAQVTFTDETPSGWQQALFTTPVPISANTTYVASYHAPVGRYSQDTSYFATSGRINGHLTALRNGADGVNGVYRYGAGVAFPNQTYSASNYWVDVVFTTTP
jgi:hypothetical protein